MAIKDALELSSILSQMDVNDVPAMRGALDEYQKVIALRGSGAVKLARKVVKDTGTGLPPRLWGYKIVQIPEEPMLEIGSEG